MSREFPRVEVQPVIRHLHLVPIMDLLFEDTIAIPQPIPPAGIVQTRQAVQEASRQSPQTTVTECGIMFLLDDILHLEPEPVHTLASNILRISIDHSVIKRTTHQELEREVVDTLLIRQRLLLLRLVPADDEVIPHGEGSTGVGSRIVAVVDGTRERGFDVTDDLTLREASTLASPASR